MDYQSEKENEEHGRTAPPETPRETKLTQKTSMPQESALISRKHRPEDASSTKKYFHLFADLLILMLGMKNAGHLLLLLGSGLALCVFANNLKVLTIDGGSKIFEMVMNRDKGVLQKIFVNLMRVTLFSVLREGYTTIFTAFINYFVMELSEMLIRAVLLSTDPAPPVRINRVIDRGNKGIILLLEKLLITVISRGIKVCMLLFRVYKLEGHYFLLVVSFNIAYVAVTHVFVQKRIRIKIEKNQEDDAYSGKIVECLSNILLVKCSGSESLERQALARRIRRILDLGYRDRIAVAVLNIIQKLIYSLLIVCIILGVFREAVISPAAVCLGDFLLKTVKELDTDIMFVALAVKDICVCYVDCRAYLECIRFYRHCQDTASIVSLLPPVSLSEYPTAVPHPECVTAESGVPPILCFRNVTVRRSGSNRSILNGLSFSVRPGEKICIIGASGAGKSTLVSLLLKLEKYSGSITVCGKELRDLQKDAVIQHIGIVPQDSGILNGTLEYNIRYGAENAPPQEFSQVTHQLSVAKIAESRVGGYLADLEVDGRNVSGGEKQRISLARALLRSPPLLILDEATSKIDVGVEHAIIKYVMSLPMAAVIITHSPIVAEMVGKVIPI